MQILWVYCILQQSEIYCRAAQVVSIILSFFLTAMVYPKVQAKAQAEIDRVVGRDRLPTLEDRKDLPYIDCIVWECLRWNPGVLCSYSIHA